MSGRAYFLEGLIIGILRSDNKPWAYICSKGFFAGLRITAFLLGL